MRIWRSFPSSVTIGATRAAFECAAVEAAARTGRVLVSGLDLLVHQAVLQVQLMTGVAQAPIEVMRAAGEPVLASRGQGRGPGPIPT